MVTRVSASGCCISLTGRLSIDRGAASVDDRPLAGNQARLAFVFLVIEHGRLIHREELADILWPDQLPDTWKPALRGVVSKVRAFLDAAGLDAQAALSSAMGCYRLVLPPGATVDVEEAAQAVRDAEDALAAGRPEQACALALVAHQTTRRELLPGEQGRWLETERRRLHGLAARALQTVAASRLELGELELSRAAAQELVEREPFREAGHQLLMRAHAEAGNRAEALRAYERCRRLFEDELGAPPAPSTVALFQDLGGRADVSGAPAADGMRTPRPPLAAPLSAAGHGGPFVGRGTELAALRETWAAALGGGPRAIFLGGEPGVGKTRLAAQLAQEVHAEGGLVLYGRADDAAVAYRPFAEVARAYLEALGPGARERATAMAGRELARLLPDHLEAAPATTSAGADRYRLFEAVRVLMAGACADGPVLLVLDDLHAATEPTLLMLQHLAEAADPMRLLIVGLHRDTEDSAAPLTSALSELSKQARFEHLAVDGLRREDVAELVRAAGAPDAAAGDLWERTGGNAFFVIEALATDGEVPPKVRHVVRGRVGRLPAPAAELLAAASVLGQEFSTSMALATVNFADEGAALAALDALVRARLLVSGPDPGRLAFAHALVRSAIYDELQPGERMRLHRHAGWLLEADGAGNERIERIATHFIAAAPLGDWRRAARYALLAAERAGGAIAFEDAVDWCERGLAVLRAADDPDPSARCALEVALATARRQLEPGHEEALWTAVATARDVGDARLLACAAIAFSPEGGSSNAAVLDQRLVDLYEEALRELGPDEDALRAQLLGALAAELAWAPDHARSEEHAAEAARIADGLGDRVTLARVLMTLRHSRTGCGDLGEAIAMEQRLLDLGKAMDDRDVLARTSVWRYESLMDGGEGEAAEVALAEASRLAADVPNPTYRYLVAYCRAGLELVRGRVNEAERLADTARGVGQGAGIQPVIVDWIWLAQRSAIALEAGTLADVEPDLRAHVEMVGLPSWWCMVAYFNAMLGRSDAAAEAIGTATVAGVSPIVRGLGGLSFGVMLSRAVALAGDEAHVAELERELAPHAGRACTPWAGGPVDWGTAWLACARGDEQEASRLFGSAETLCERVGAPLWAARCRRDRAELVQVA